MRWCGNLIRQKERDEFLGRELADLERSALSLKDIIAELEKTIDARFTEGLKQINLALRDFFHEVVRRRGSKIDSRGT